MAHPFVIERGVPLPAGAAGTPAQVLPLAAMAVGDSVRVQLLCADSTEVLCGALMAYSAMTGQRFTTQPDNFDFCRIWRIE